MNLNDFNKKNTASQALNENYKMKFDVRKLSIVETNKMLKKVRTLAMEARHSANSYDYLTNPSFMKLVFMEQALVNHFNSITSKKPRIVIENEEVDRSQVVLAAQDMVDNVQKMIENVSDMLVKELPALTDSIQSEVGVTQSDQFNQQVKQALTTLQASLQQSQETLKSALNVVTGQGAGFEQQMQQDMAGQMPTLPDQEMGMPGQEMSMPPTELGAEEIPEPPEAEPLGGAGRPKR